MRVGPRAPAIVAAGAALAVGVAAYSYVHLGAESASAPPNVLQGQTPTVHETTRPLDAAERRGRSLYERGVSSLGRPLTAYLADGETALPASAAACARCHGESGQGGREGAVAVPPIDARRLFAGGTHDGRVRGAYDDATLIRAITRGVAEDGRPLAAAMPRFPLRSDDLDDLLSYLKRLGSAPEPGVTAHTVTIGVVVAREDEASNSQRPTDATVRRSLDALESHLRAVNAQGGIFQRRIELRHVRAADIARDGDERVRDAVFAIVRLRETDEDRAPDSDIPVIDAGAHAPSSEAQAHHPSTFWLYAGPYAEGRAAAARGEGTMIVVQARGREADASPLFLEGARNEAARRMRRVLEVETDANDASGRTTAEKLAVHVRASKADGVLVAGETSEVRAVLNALLRRDIGAAVYVPSATAWEVFHARNGPWRAPSRWLRVVGNVPLRTELGAGRAVGAPPSPVPDPDERRTLDANAASSLVVEALKRAGATLTRAAFVRALESVRELETGTSPPVTFSPSRRVGVDGAWTARIDPEGALVVERPREAL
jgi:hypothetical protein